MEDDSSSVTQGQFRFLERSSLEAYVGLTVTAIIALNPQLPTSVKYLLIILVMACWIDVVWNARYTAGLHITIRCGISVILIIGGTVWCYSMRPKISYFFLSTSPTQADNLWILRPVLIGPEGISDIDINIQDQDRLGDFPPAGSGTIDGEEIVSAYRKLKMAELNSTGDSGNHQTEPIWWKTKFKDHARWHIFLTYKLGANLESVAEYITAERTNGIWRFAELVTDGRHKFVACRDDQLIGSKEFAGITSLCHTPVLRLVSP
jgi:hypothetical protein